MKATHRLIDSVWTIEYNIISETEAEIIKFSSDDPEGYKNERVLPQCNVIEDDNRNITGLLIRDNYKPYCWVNNENCDHNYIVINPKYIFDYK